MVSIPPTGAGNPRPKLATGPVEIVEKPRVVGANGAHVQLVVRQDGTVRKAIVFGGGSEHEKLADAGRVKLAFEPILSEWNGHRRAELKVVDWRPA